jgi:hypothetical protein
MNADVQSVVVYVKKCPRCGADHSNVVFTPLINPINDYEYWVFCPVTHQPLLLTLRLEGNQPHVA